MTEPLNKELIPGIPNDITLEKITPKLQWRDFHTLSSVSPSWLHVIRTHKVYNARVRSHSTETFVLVNCSPERNIHAIFLYSMRDNSSHELPTIVSDDFHRGVPRFCQCVTMDGKVYVLGGLVSKGSVKGGLHSEVHVLDLCGLRQWKQCTTMPQPKSEFGCGVKNGKIYVFGATRDIASVPTAEVYDPKENTWSIIRPIPSRRHDFDVATVGAELVVYGGSILVYSDYDGMGNGYHVKYADFLEVYHPAKNEWRTVGCLGRSVMETMFEARGKFYSMSTSGIQVHDVHGHSWTHLHSFPVLSQFGWPDPVLAVDDDLFAIVDGRNLDEGGRFSYLIQSRGLDSRKKEIVWQHKGKLSVSFLPWPANFKRHFIHPLQL